MRGGWFQQARQGFCKTLIDHVVVNSEEKNQSVRCIANRPKWPFSHILYSGKTGRNKSCNNKESNITVRSTKKYDKDEFIKADWSRLYISRNIDSAWSIFEDIFTLVLDEVQNM